MFNNFDYFMQETTERFHQEQIRDMNMSQQLNDLVEMQESLNRLTENKRNFGGSFSADFEKEYQSINEYIDSLRKEIKRG